MNNREANILNNSSPETETHQHQHYVATRQPHFSDYMLTSLSLSVPSWTQGEGKESRRKGGGGVFVAILLT